MAGAELPPDEEFVVHNRMIQSLPKVRRHMPMNIKWSWWDPDDVVNLDERISNPFDVCDVCDF